MVRGLDISSSSEESCCSIPNSSPLDDFWCPGTQDTELTVALHVLCVCEHVCEWLARSVVQVQKCCMNFTVVSNGLSDPQD